jgi:hypothetical protein
MKDINFQVMRKERKYFQALEHYKLRLFLKYNLNEGIKVQQR